MHNEPTYLIPASLLQAVVNYLAQRPYAEVAQAMDALKTLPRHEPEPPAQ
jgi:hypothetical protein